MAYTIGDVLVRTVMQGVSGLPTDRYINDWAFQFDHEPSDGDLTNLFAAVSDFFRGGVDATDTVGRYIGEAVDRGITHQIQAYSIVSGPLGAPIFTSDWLGPVAAVGDNYPAEVAVTLSFHGDLVGLSEEVGTTRPRARRRGRVYIGPLTIPALSSSAPEPKVTDIFVGALHTRARAMQAVAAGYPAFASWCVWSRAAETLYPVVGGWTDDAPDSQRRRGAVTTARTAFVI